MGNAGYGPAWAAGEAVGVIEAPARAESAESRAASFPARFVSGLRRTFPFSPSLVRYIVLIWALTRLGLIAISAVFVGLFHHLRPTGNLISTWARFDATAYARISQHGYTLAVPADFAFFPLQPLLTHIFTLITFGNADAAGVLVSNIACLITFFGVAQLALVEFDEGTARRAVLYLAVFPTALFLFVGYADALFLALATWCFVALRRRAWWQAGLLGALAAATRQMGLFLILPFLWEYGTSHQWRLRNLRFDALAVALIPAGLLAFMAWLWYAVGDPLGFIHAEGAWAHHFTPPWQTLIHSIELIPHRYIHGPAQYIRNVLELIATLGFAGLILVGIPRLRLSYTLYSAAVWLLVVCYPTEPWPLESGARYVLLLFPAFLTLAQLTKARWLTLAAAVVFALLLAVLAQYYFRGALII